MNRTHSDGGSTRELSELEENLDYRFEDRSLLVRAVTHRSFANEHRGVEEDNQRLEFLGDAVLGVVIAEAVFRADKEAAEGDLSRRLSDLVCEPALVERARELELGEFLRLGRGEELTGGREKEGLLADAYEAVLGAIFLDGGHEDVRRVIRHHFEEGLDDVATRPDPGRGNGHGDFKSQLQREVQKRQPVRPEYEIVETTGPPHERHFVAQVCVAGQPVGRGEGRSKKEAEQAAAQEAMAGLESKDGSLYRLLSKSTLGESESE